MRVLAVLAAPADYTLDLIRNVYQARGVDWVFLKRTSPASDNHGPLTKRPVVGELSFGAMLVTASRFLKRYDVLILNGWTGRFNVIVALLNLMFYRKPMAWESDTMLSIPKNRLRRMAKWLWLGILFRRRFCWGFAGGSYGHKDLFRHYGMREDRIVLAPMVVDNERIARFRRSPGRSRSPFCFVYLGRLVKLKCVDAIIRAFQGVEADVALHIVGNGPEKEDLVRLAASDSRIVFHGALHGDEKFRLLATMSCLVLFSRAEQWGLVVNEALSVGVPCIVSDAVGAQRDLIGDTGAGLVVPSGDVEALRKAMTALSKDTTRHARLSERAVERMKTWSYREYSLNFDAFLSAVEMSAGGKRT